MDFTTDLPLVDGKNSLFIFISKFPRFCGLNPIFLGEGELSAKQVAFSPQYMVSFVGCNATENMWIAEE